MSRFRDFTNFEDSAYKHIDSIVENFGVTGDLFRPSYNEGAGFSEEVGELQKIKRILIYLTQAKESSRMTGSRDLNINKSRFFGVTTEPSIQVRDQVRVDGVYYEVKAVNKAFKTQVQLDLEVK
jgi:hypothetical protein